MQYKTCYNTVFIKLTLIYPFLSKYKPSHSIIPVPIPPSKLLHYSDCVN